MEGNFTKPILPDLPGLERHQSLKRWERMSQSKALRRRDEESDNPALPCPWKSMDKISADNKTVDNKSADNDVSVRYEPAQLLRLFTGGFYLVRFLRRNAGDSGLYVLREGIPWEQWFPRLLQNYLHGVAMPPPFQTRKRLPSLWIEKALRWPTALQAEWFDRLRAAGLLPPLLKMEPASVTPWLRWEEVKDRFLDFKDSPPLQS